MNPYLFLVLTDEKQIDINNNNIINIICTYFNTDLDALVNRNRTRKISIWRNICFYFLYKYERNKLKYIENYFKRDHSTILQGVIRVETLIEKDPRFKRHIENISNKIYDIKTK